MIYDLWDLDAGNIIDTYETETQALAAVRDLVAANGASYVEALSLGWEAEDGSLGIVAEGRTLLDRAGSSAVSVRSDVAS